VGFFGWGFFGGFGALLSELFPTRVRGTATGFSFNVGRGVGAIAPFTIGVLAQTHGIGLSLTLTAVFYLISAFVVLLMPETVGKELD
jgi:MFS family permease